MVDVRTITGDTGSTTNASAVAIIIAEIINEPSPASAFSSRSEPRHVVQAHGQQLRRSHIRHAGNQINTSKKKKRKIAHETGNYDEGPVKRWNGSLAQNMLFNQVDSNRYAETLYLSYILYACSADLSSFPFYTYIYIQTLSFVGI